MQSQAQKQQLEQQHFYDAARSFGQAPAAPPADQRLQQAAIGVCRRSPNLQPQSHTPPEHHRYQYHADAQAKQFVSRVATNIALISSEPLGALQHQPLAQAAGYAQFELAQKQQQQQQQSQYSGDVANYIAQPVQQSQQQQQWSSAPQPFFYPVSTQTTDQQYCNELTQVAQVAPANCAPCGACQPGSPMSTQSPSPGAATSILQTPITPPIGIGPSGGGCGAASSSGQSSSYGPMASPSGASSTISSSESVGNMSINLEQYISKRNERERSRVRNVNDAFDNLKNSLPLEMEKLTKRMSKVEILRTAISYIKKLEEVLGSKQQVRDDMAILQQQQQQQQQQPQQCANGPGSSMIRKRPRSGSVGRLMRSSLNQQRLLHECALDCENSMRFAWRHDRAASSLSRHDLLVLDGELASGAAYLKRKLDFNEQTGYQAKSQQERACVIRQEVPTSCRQDTFRQEQALVQSFRRRQQQDQLMQHNHQNNRDLNESAGQYASGFDEFNPNVRCYNERNFDNY